MTGDEFDDLLYRKFRLRPVDLIPALRTMPDAERQAAELSADELSLLDESGFTEDPNAYAQVTADALLNLGLLINTAYSANTVATLLGVDHAELDRRRRAGALWAIDDNGQWVFPAMQFEFDPKFGRHSQIRGLDRVFAALPANLHPLAVAGFLHTPHPDLVLAGRSTPPLEWLRSGGELAPVMRLIEAAAWANS